MLSQQCKQIQVAIARNNKSRKTFTRFYCFYCTIHSTDCAPQLAVRVSASPSCQLRSRWVQDHDMSRRRGKGGRGTRQMLTLSCINRKPSKNVSCCVIHVHAPSTVLVLIRVQNARTDVYDLNRLSKLLFPNAPVYSQCIRKPKC
jgi:hypothetical protein